jgi:hypothetical protein
MRYGCKHLFNGKKLFDIWKQTGKCPFNDSQFQRPINFVEKLDIWSYGKAKSTKTLLKMLMKEKMIFDKKEIK